jgi:putative oxygen-independent coproporphyrinogen III oxidase
MGVDSTAAIPGTLQIGQWVEWLNAPPMSAYIHIPFCRRRCFYCDFPIYVVGDRGLNSGANSGPSQSVQRYLQVLGREIERSPQLNDRPLQTVFFGGGTPSVLDGAQLGQILAGIDRRFGLAADAEIAMEIDPGTFDLAKLQGYQAAGINRFSFGVQAFQAELLAACGRAHTVDDVAIAMDLVQRAGIENYSLDLISGLPGQSLAQWERSLKQAIAYGPTHISTYDLTIEAGTVFGKRYRPGEGALPDDETTATMYRLAHDRLTAAGYAHYEVSNYARSGYQCQHNRVYWENRAFYGFGMGATSYLRGDRAMRPRQLQAYFDWVETVDPMVFGPVPEAEELLLDTLMVGLRLMEGLAIEGLVQRFGDRLINQVLDCLKPYEKPGWVVIDDRIRLSAPEGFLFSNVVLVKLFDRFDRQR